MRRHQHAPPVAAALNCFPQPQAPYTLAWVATVRRSLRVCRNSDGEECFFPSSCGNYKVTVLSGRTALTGVSVRANKTVHVFLYQDERDKLAAKKRESGTRFLSVNDRVTFTRQPRSHPLALLLVAREPTEKGTWQAGKPRWEAISSGMLWRTLFPK